MSDIYSIYESSLNHVSTSIKNSFNNQPLDDNEASKLKTDLQEANRLIKQMNLELNSLKSVGKKVPQVVLTYFQKYKIQVEGFNKQLLELRTNINNEKYENIGRGGSKEMKENDINTSDKLIQEEYIQSTKLNNIQKETNDIEKLENNIQMNLNEQGEQMRNMLENIHGLERDATHSNKLVDELIIQARRNKRIIYGCFGVIITLFIIISMLK